jgi:hypothetical protein
MNKVSPIDLGLFRNRSFSAGLAINITFMLSPVLPGGADDHAAVRRGQRGGIVGAIFFGVLGTRGYVAAAHLAAWADLGFVAAMTILTTTLKG